MYYVRIRKCLKFNMGGANFFTVPFLSSVQDACSYMKNKVNRICFALIRIGKA